MFQRLKGAIDSRIAEEQARQRQAQAQAQASTQSRQAPRRRPQNGGTIPNKSTGAGNVVSTEKGLDPKDFEPEFVIGDGDSRSSSVKDASAADNSDEPSNSDETAVTTAKPVPNTQPGAADTTDAVASETEPRPQAAERPVELPADVRAKLRKLDRLEAKYGELLKAYRTAHARVQVVEPFEAALRENTPLTSIADPGALVEYLNQTKVKGDMVIEEFKRVTADRDGFKKKFEHSETVNAQLKNEIEELKSSAQSSIIVSSANEMAKTELDTDAGVKSPKSPKIEDTKSEAINKGRIPSFSLFSPRLAADKEVSAEASEDLFSYDSEIPRLEAELEESTNQIKQLRTDAENLRKDLKVARESTEGMMQTLEERTKEVNALRDNNAELESSNSSLEKQIVDLGLSTKEVEGEAKDLRKRLDILTHQQDSGNRIQVEFDNAKEVWKTRESDLEGQILSLKMSTNSITEELVQKNKVVKDLEDSQAVAKKTGHPPSEQDKSTEKKLSVMNGIMNDIRSQLDGAKDTIASLKNELLEQSTAFASKPSTKIFQLIGNDAISADTKIDTREEAVEYLCRSFGIEKGSSSRSKDQPFTAPDPTPATESSTTATKTPNLAGKKKNHKKKKGGRDSHQIGEPKDTHGPIKVSETLPETQGQDQFASQGVDSTSHLEQEIDELKSQLDSRLATIDRLSQQIKDQDALREEIETLRDDLLVQGEEHVEARDALKKALQARSDLESIVKTLENDLSESRTKALANNESETAREKLGHELKALSEKFTATESDLKAAEQLASARFKDISDLKELLSKAQPELRSLRNEIVELKSVKDDLKNKRGEITRLESRHEDLKSEMKGLSRRLGDKDHEIKTLQQKLEQESRARAKAEEELTTVQSELRVAESKKAEANERSAQTSKDLSKAKEDAAQLRSKLRDLEDQLSAHLREISNLKEDVSLKGALHASSQSLVQSLRDQTHELSTQAREALAKTDNLEEELSEAQRMLSERTREGQTMRTLLNQSESGTELRLREMRERMDSAVEERDRIEDEANVASRRMIREVEDAKNKVRDAQRQLKSLENERDELETKSRSWRRTREELEQAAESTKLEIADVRAAMKGLREALDESERQIREAEIHKQDLRKQSEEATERIDKLTKANKSLSEEIKALQSGATRKSILRPSGASVNTGVESELQSSRMSLDSSAARSPAPPLNRGNSKNGQMLNAATTAITSGPNVGLSQAPVDYVYLKNVLLQFLERKDKAHQRQLIPVLGMLLHFDREEEQKFVSAISAR